METSMSRKNFQFPFLFGGTFIEARRGELGKSEEEHFPSFSEGLSLRP